MAASVAAIFLKAETFRSRGLFSKARPLYERAFGKSGDARTRFNAALALAALGRGLGQVRSAERWLKRARDSGGGASREGRAALEIEEVLVARARGRYAYSLRRLTSLFERFDKERDSQACAFLAWAMGGALRFMGRLEDSRKTFLKSLFLSRKARDRDGEIYALLGLGGVCRILGDVAGSERRYREARQRLKKSRDLFARAYVFCGLANALRQKGDLKRSEALYGRARRLYRLLGDDADLGYVEWGLGRVKMRSGKVLAAEKFFLRAEKLFGRAHENRGLVLSRLSLAQSRHARGKTGSARILFDKALRLSRSSGLSTHLEDFT